MLLQVQIQNLKGNLSWNNQFLPNFWPTQLAFLRREAGFLRSPHGFSQRFVNPCQILRKPGLRFRNTVKTDFFLFFFSPALLLLVLARRRKSRGRGGGKKKWGKRWCKNCQMSNTFCLSSGQKFGVAVNAQKMIHPHSPFHPPWLRCPLLIPETPSLYNLFYRVIQSCSATDHKYVITEPSSFARFTSKNRGTFEFTRAARTKKPRFLKQP